MTLMLRRFKPLYGITLMQAALMLILSMGSVSLPSSLMAAQMELKVLELRHRPASELVPILEPFIASGGTITGKDYRLIVRSTPQNIDQIKQLLKDLDSALRQMTVYVSTDYDAIRAEREIAVEGSIGTPPVDLNSNQDQSAIVIDSGREVQGGASGGGLALQSRHTTTREPQAQTIRVQEGQWANIQTGQAVPVTEQVTNPDGTITRTIRYHTVSSGFQVRPQLNGEEVILFVRPRQDRLNQSGNGSYQHSALETTIRTRLGEWVQLGGVTRQMQGSGSEIASSAQSSGQQNQQVFVKIELEP